MYNSVGYGPSKLQEQEQAVMESETHYRISRSALDASFVGPSNHPPAKFRACVDVEVTQRLLQLSPVRSLAKRQKRCNCCSFHGEDGI